MTIYKFEREIRADQSKLKNMKVGSKQWQTVNDHLRSLYMLIILQTAASKATQ